VEGRGHVPGLAASAGLGNPLQPRLEPVRRLEISPRQCECDRPSMRRLMEPFWAWWSSLWSCSVCGGFSWVSGGAPPSARTAAPLAHVRTPTNIAWRAVRRPSDITTDRTPWLSINANISAAISDELPIAHLAGLRILRGGDVDHGLRGGSPRGRRMRSWPMANRACLLRWPASSCWNPSSRLTSRTMRPAPIPHAGRRTQSGRVSAFTSTLAIATSTAVADVLTW
jgi:hypothetical protein